MTSNDSAGMRCSAFALLLPLLLIPACALPSISSSALSLESAVRALGTAAEAAYLARCTASSLSCGACSFDACGISQPVDRTCFPSGFGSPPVCQTAGQVCCFLSSGVSLWVPCDGFGFLQLLSLTDSTVRVATAESISNTLVAQDVCISRSLNSAFVANQV